MKRDSLVNWPAAFRYACLCTVSCTLPAWAQLAVSETSGHLSPQRQTGLSYAIQGDEKTAAFAHLIRFHLQDGSRLIDFAASNLPGIGTGAACCAGPTSLWGDPTAAGNLLTVGYGWRRFRIETAAFAPDADKHPSFADKRRLDFRSGRLSFAASPNLSFQLDRSYLSDLDQFEPNGRVRRISFLAHYALALGEGRWQTTLAWGRSLKNDAEPVYGYLVESALHWSGAQSVFGRLEQVGSSELARDGAPHQEWRKLNKLSLGYVRQVTAASHGKVDVGMLLSRYFVPSDQAPAYDSAPFAGMLFLRLRLD